MGTLADVVKPNFITVAPEDTLGEVAEKMTGQNVGAVVVKDYGRLIGILTERDMLRARVFFDNWFSEARVIREGEFQRVLDLLKGRGLVYEREGAGADVLDVREVSRPEPGPGQVRVRVEVSAVNPTDVKIRGGATPRPTPSGRWKSRSSTGAANTSGGATASTIKSIRT